MDEKDSVRQFDSQLHLPLPKIPFARDLDTAESQLKEEFLIAKDSVPTEAPPNGLPARQTSSYQDPFARYLADDAKVWVRYLELTKGKGEEFIRVWNSDLDTILIFAGLFSAILTAFLIEIRKSLQEDLQTITNALLQEIFLTLRDPSTSASTSSSLPHFEPSIPLVWVNGLWFVSLTVTLTGAFGTILAKGWVAQFIPASAGLPLVDACNRHRRFFGNDRKHLRTVINALPITLHIGFYLFFAGLVILLFQDDPNIGVVVTALIALTMLLYLGSSLRPLLNPNSPFRTPISDLIPLLPALSLPLVLVLDVAGHVWFPPQKRLIKRSQSAKGTRLGRLELLCLWISSTRVSWITGMVSVFKSFQQLIAVTPPLPEDHDLQIDVLVGLFSFSRSHSIEDAALALAGLPSTDRLQLCLYHSDPIPALTRGLSGCFMDGNLPGSSIEAQAYLSVLLSLVQTTHSSLLWAAGSVLPLLEAGGLLNDLNKFQGSILELVLCIHLHMWVRTGFLATESCVALLPVMMKKSMHPSFKKKMVEACIASSAVDNGRTLEKVLQDNRNCIFDIEFVPILSSMIKHPQNNVRKSALSALSKFLDDAEICSILIEQDLVQDLLEQLPISDPHLQVLILAHLPMFIRDDYDADNSHHAYWTCKVFQSLLATMLKSNQLTIRRASTKCLLKFTQYDSVRGLFLGEDHVETLLHMVEIEDPRLQMRALEILAALIQHRDVQTVLLTSSGISRIIQSLENSYPYVKKCILAFLTDCIQYENIRAEIALPLNLKVLTAIPQKRIADLSIAGLSLLSGLSQYDQPCAALFNYDILLNFVKYIAQHEGQDYISTTYAANILQNCLANNTHHKAFIEAFHNNQQTSLLFSNILSLFISVIKNGEPYIQEATVKIYTECLKYYDFREAFINYDMASALYKVLKTPSIKFITKSYIFEMLIDAVTHAEIMALLLKKDHCEMLFSITETDSSLSRYSGKLLSACLKYSNEPRSLLPDKFPEKMLGMLESSNIPLLLLGLVIIAETITQVQDNSQAVSLVIDHSVIQALIDIYCETNHPNIRKAAIETLLRLQCHKETRAMLLLHRIDQILLRMMQHKEETVHIEATEVLINLLSHQDAYVDISSRETTIPVLVNMLNSERSDIQICAARVFVVLCEEISYIAVLNEGIILKICEIVETTNGISNEVAVKLKSNIGYVS